MIHKKIFTTKNAVEHEYIDSISSLGISFDACFCSVLAKVKGVYDLIEIWQEVVNTSPSSKLVIIGEGPESSNLPKAIKSRSLENRIILTGFLTEDEKIKMIKSSKLFVFPSHNEGWGIVVTEAMSCGVPVICYDLPVYNVYSGGIVKVQLGDTKQMAKSILNLLTAENQRLLLGEKAKHVSRTLNWDNIAADQFKVFNHVTNSN